MKTHSSLTPPLFAKPLIDPSCPPQSSADSPPSSRTPPLFGDERTPTNPRGFHQEAYALTLLARPLEVPPPASSVTPLQALTPLLDELEEDPDKTLLNLRLAAFERQLTATKEVQSMGDEDDTKEIPTLDLSREGTMQLAVLRGAETGLFPITEQGTQRHPISNGTQPYTLIPEQERRTQAIRRVSRISPRARFVAFVFLGAVCTAPFALMFLAFWRR